MDALEAQRVSRMLWGARESLSMWADVVEWRTGKTDQWTRRQIADIDTYRAEKGWSASGFGRESSGVWNMTEADTVYEDGRTA